MNGQIQRVRVFKWPLGGVNTKSHVKIKVSRAETFLKIFIEDWYIHTMYKYLTPKG